MVLSFREDWEETCGRGCCHEGSGGADFEMSVFETPSGAADFIVQQLSHEGDCEHRVVENWQDVLDFCEQGGACPSSGAHSVDVPDTYVDYDAEGWAELEARKNRREALQAEIRKLVDEKIEQAKSLEAKRHEAAQKAQEATVKRAEEQRKVATREAAIQMMKEALKACVETGTHLKSLDPDGFCNACGHK